jgi:hypothetical protein
LPGPLLSWRGSAGDQASSGQQGLRPCGGTFGAPDSGDSGRSAAVKSSDRDAGADAGIDIAAEIADGAASAAAGNPVRVGPGNDVEGAAFDRAAVRLEKN